MPTMATGPCPNKVVISARDVGVSFRFQGRRQTMTQRFGNLLRGRTTSFWALRNLSFDVNHGEAFFVIGRNGAGKTTLLKVMAGTMVSDTGSLTINGQISAFLSMGLGFCLQLSGLDNIDLSLRFMGADSKDLPALRENIVDFAQLGAFLESPVSTYSAGMRARLAFAIATSVEPEILIMDEVINAGDEEFREKCHIRMEKMLTAAKAVIVCTHNLSHVEAVATRVMWIEQGEIRGIGEPEEIVNKYREFIRMVRNNPMYDLENRQKRICSSK